MQVTASFLRRAIRSDAALFLAALSLYARTLSPTVYTFDSAELAAGAYSLGIVHATGYPLYLLLAKAFTLAVPLGDIAFRVNLFSAACAALAVAVLRRVMRLLTGSAEASLLSAAIFGVSYPLWSEAVVAEVYTLHLLFVALVLWLALRWRETGKPGLFIGTLAVWGLSFGNHMSTMLIAPGLAVLAWEGWRGNRFGWKQIALGAAAASAGLLVYLYLPLRYAADPALNYAEKMNVDLSTLRGALWMARGEMFADAMFGYGLAEIPGEMIQFAELLWLSFFGVGVVVAAIGAWELWRRDRAVFAALGLVFAANAAFYVNYRVFDKDTMFLPAFLIVAVWMAAGLSALQRRLPGAVWGAAAVLAIMIVINYPRADLSGNTITREFAEEVFAQAAPGAFVAGSWIEITPLEYLQVVEGRRPDVTLFDWGLYSLGRRAALRAEGMGEAAMQSITQEEVRRRVEAELAAGRAVYSLDENPALKDGYLLIEEGVVFRVERKGP